MKLIDVLQKVSYGEMFKFMLEDEVYYVDKLHFLCHEDGERVDWLIDDVWLNNPVRIIEDKKIEKLDLQYYHDEPAIIDDMAYKINEIIDILNKDSDK